MAALMVAQGIDNAAVLVVDNRSFDVLAYVGNSRWSVDEGSGFAIDLIHRPRSTGSILKPLLYARMLDEGELLPTTLVPDVPSQFAGYMPENYDRTFRGAVPAREALARSLNVPAVRMLSRHGVDKFYDFLERMGMSTLHRPPQGYGLTLILGGAEGTLWDLTSMYANVAHVAEGGRAARGANRLRPRLVTSDEIDTGRPVGLSVGASWLTLDALKEVVRPGVDAQWRRFEGSRVEDGHELWAPGRVGHRQHRPLHGRRVGRQRDRGGPPRADRRGQRRPDPLRRVQRPGARRLGAAAGVCAPARHRLQGRRVPRGARLRYRGGARAAREPLRAAEPPPPGRAPGRQRCRRRRLAGRRPLRGRRRDNAPNLVRPPGRAGVLLQEASQRIPPSPAGSRGLQARRRRVLGLDGLPVSEAGTAIYIPWELGDERGRVVVAVAHRRPDATLHWHLDDRYVGTTETFHEQALDIPPGRHTITVVDQWGGRRVRSRCSTRTRRRGRPLPLLV